MAEVMAATSVVGTANGVSVANGHDAELNDEAGPSQIASGSSASRYRFRPTRHLYEPPQPPPLDHKVEEEAAAQAAALAAGFEGRKMRRFLQRRTVDYMGSWMKYRDQRMRTSTPRGDYYLKPSPHWVVDLLPASASCSPASSAAPHLVHTSTNKIRTPVNCVTWLPSSRRLLTGSSSGEFTLWNGLTFNFETILQACDNGVRDLQWSHSGNLLLSGDAGGTVKYFLPNMNNVLAIDAHRESIRGISFSPDDARWISGSDDSTIKIFNTERGLEESVLKGHGWDVKCVQWHPFKGLIASGGKDNLVKFWDPRRGGREIGTYHGHKNTIQALEFSPNHVSSSELLASASRDQTVKLYDLRMIKEYMTLKAAPVDGGSAETGGVCSLSWHPSTPLLSSGLSTGVLQHHSLLPSAAPDLPISTVPQAHDQSIWAMSWHPLGQILATGGNDCFTRWWQRERLEEGDLKAVKDQDGGVLGEGVQSRSRRDRGAYADDDDDGDANSSFIPGLGGAGPPRGAGGGAPGGGSGGGSEPRDSFQRRDRPPPPPGFGFQEEFSRPTPPAAAPPPPLGYGNGGGMGGAPPPRATGANVGARDAGWGRGRPGGNEGGSEYAGEAQQGGYGGQSQAYGQQQGGYPPAPGPPPQLQQSFQRPQNGAYGGAAPSAGAGAGGFALPGLGNGGPPPGGAGFPGFGGQGGQGPPPPQGNYGYGGQQNYQQQQQQQQQQGRGGYGYGR